MTGMDRVTGKPLSGDAHLAQSIGDVLSTPIGARVGRRDYGSLLFELVDAPFNAGTRALMRAAIALALGRWEPRLRLTRVRVDVGAAAGEVLVRLEGERTDAPAPTSFTRLTLPLRLSGAAA
jgi:uncharacterized protein